MALVSISWRPDKKELRSFGLVVIIGLGLIGLFFQLWLDKPDVAYILYVAGAVVGLPGLTGTVVGLPGYWLWMGVAFVMGNIVGRVLLSVVYYGLITPMGMVRRALNDKLRLRRPQVESYWVDIEDNEADSRYERLF